MKYTEYVSQRVTVSLIACLVIQIPFLAMETPNDCIQFNPYEKRAAVIAPQSVHSVRKYDAEIESR